MMHEEFQQSIFRLSIIAFSVFQVLSGSSVIDSLCLQASLSLTYGEHTQPWRPQTGLSSVLSSNPVYPSLGFSCLASGGGQHITFWLLGGGS